MTEEFRENIFLEISYFEIVPIMKLILKKLDCEINFSRNFLLEASYHACLLPLILLFVK